MQTRNKKTYKKPKITSKKIKMNLFLTNRHFMGQVEDLLSPNFFVAGYS